MKRDKGWVWKSQRIGLLPHEQATFLIVKHRKMVASITLDPTDQAFYSITVRKHPDPKPRKRKR